MAPIRKRMVVQGPPAVHLCVDQWPLGDGTPNKTRQSTTRQPSFGHYGYMRLKPLRLAEPLRFEPRRLELCRLSWLLW